MSDQKKNEDDGYKMQALIEELEEKYKVWEARLDQKQAEIELKAIHELANLAHNKEEFQKNLELLKQKSESKKKELQGKMEELKELEKRRKNLVAELERIRGGEDKESKNLKEKSKKTLDDLTNNWKKIMEKIERG